MQDLVYGSTAVIQHLTEAGSRVNLQEYLRAKFERPTEDLRLSDYCTPSTTVDNYNAIQAAVNDAISMRRRLIVDGDFYSSRSIVATLPSTFDSTRSLVMEGLGKSNSYLYFPAGVRGIVLTSQNRQYSDIVYGAFLRDFSVQCNDYNILTAPTPSAGSFTAGIYHEVGLGMCEFSNVGSKGFDYGFRGENTLFLSRIIGCSQLQCYNGLYMSNRGTSNQIDQNYVYGSMGTAYRLTGAYSSFGSLACDRSEGDIYIFSYFSGSIGSLAYESYQKGTVGKVFRASLSNMTVEHLYTQDLQGKATASTVLFESNASTVLVGTWQIVDTKSAETPSAGLVGVGINNINSRLSFGYIDTPYRLRTGSPTWSDAVNEAYTEIDGAKFANKWGKSFLGTLTGNATKVSSGSSILEPLVMFDMYGGGRYSGANGENTMTYGPRLQVGQVGIERRPDLHGVAGYICTNSGTSTLDQTLYPIPFVYRGTSKPSSPVVGAIWVNPSDNKIRHFAGTNWYDAMGNLAN